MLKQDKIRLMTRMTIFEESPEGRDALKISKYYKNDFMRWELIKTFLSVTIGYALILALVGMYQSEYLIANAVELDYQGIGMRILGIYLVLLVVYGSSSYIGYSYRFGRKRKNLNRYYKSLKRLSAIYQEEEREYVKQEGTAK